jgi:hypothetical protein
MMTGFHISGAQASVFIIMIRLTDYTRDVTLSDITQKQLLSLYLITHVKCFKIVRSKAISRSNT